MSMRLSSQSLTVAGTPMPIYNQALRHSRVPILSGLRASCVGPESYPGGELTVRISEPSTKWVVPIPRLSPGSKIQLELCPSNIAEAALAAIRNSNETQLSVELDSDWYECKLSLTAPWCWPAQPAARTALAAYVLPHDAVVRRMVARTEAVALARTKNTPRSTSQCAKTWARLLYEELANDIDFVYENPRVLAAGGSSYQIIRAPYDLRRRTSPVSATCLDLSLLIASCFEAAGLASVIYLCGSHSEKLTHSMVGAWTSGRSGFKPRIRNVRQLLQAVATGEMFVFEATGLCRDRSLDFPEAMKKGTERLRSAEYVEAIDINASRPPLGKIAPLERALDPTLAHAQLLSMRLAAWLETPFVETLHLVHGVLSANGEFTQTLFERCGANRERVCEEIEKVLRSRATRRSSGISKGLERCLNEAQVNAKDRGSGIVRENDLWWAFADLSPSFSATMSATGSSTLELRRALGELSPNEREESTMYGL